MSICLYVGDFANYYIEGAVNIYVKVLTPKETKKGTDTENMYYSPLFCNVTILLIEVHCYKALLLL